MFNAQRISIARLRRRMSMRDLAIGIGIDTSVMKRLEAGTLVLDEALVIAIGKALDFPAAFFKGADIACAEHAEVSYRSRRSTLVSTREAMRAITGIALLVTDWMTTSFNLPKPNLPDLSGHDPAIAAAVLREEWQLGGMAIRNVVHLLEANGVRVFNINETTDDVDAFSFFRGSEPFVFLNAQKSSARSRFDACHELGHLVLHRTGDLHSDEAERQADAFASAFLMPADVMPVVCVKNSTVDQLVIAKRDWNVSVAALNYRLHDLGVLDDWTYRSNCIALSKRGWRKVEPEDRPRERSLVWEKIIKRLRSDGKSLDHVADTIAIPSSELKSFAAGMSLMSADSLEGMAGSQIRPGRGTPWLRVVTKEGILPEVSKDVSVPTESAPLIVQS